MPGDPDSTPVRKIDDATYGRPPDSGIRRGLLKAKRWFLLDADRHLVTGLLLGGTFVVITLVGAFGPVPVRAFLGQGVSPGAALVELLKSIVSVVVIVLSINQLVLSPGLGPVGSQRERYEESLELRDAVEAHTDTHVSPSSPAAFLAVLLDAIADQAGTVEAEAERAGVPALASQASEFAATVEREAGTVRRLVGDGRFGEFEVVSAALRFAISEKVRTLRGIEKSTEEALPGSLGEALEEMDTLLEQFTVAREYLKTIYIREQYIGLSDGLLYTGLPAIIVTYSAAQVYTPSVFPGATLGIANRLLFVSAAVTVSLVPFAHLVSHVFRLTALSRSTLFVGPFDARESDESLDETRGHGG